MSPASNGGKVPYLADADVTLYQGDALDVLGGLADDSVDCCVTSPPYWGLRDYGHADQLGLEPTPDRYVQRLVAILGQVRRVVRGTLWLNLGDSYAGSWGAQSRPNGSDIKSSLEGGSMLSARQIEAHPRGTHTGSLKNTPGLKPKDLIGVPWRVAFALQEDGWYLRSAITWCKPNPMPESVTDRPTKSTEMVFLLSKDQTYYFGQDDLREPAAWERWGDQTAPKHEGTDTAAGWIKPKTKNELAHFDHLRTGLVRQTWQERKAAGATRGNVAFGDNVGAGTQRAVHGEGLSHDLGDPSLGRNIRDHWLIATEPYPDAHFAVFPQELARRMILGGCPEGGTVLDPFGGSGTTALVARKHGRRAILIELNPDYCELAAGRLAQQSLLADATWDRTKHLLDEAAM